MRKRSTLLQTSRDGCSGCGMDIQTQSGLEGGLGRGGWKVASEPGW